MEPEAHLDPQIEAILDETKTPEELRDHMRAQLKAMRDELLPKARERLPLPAAPDLNEAMKKAGISRKGRRAYMAAQRKKKVA